MSAAGEWFLVMDAGRARILRGLPAHGEPAGPEIVLEGPVHRLGELLTDRPGRSFASDGSGRRSSVEPGSDPVREERRAFVHRVLDVIETHRRSGDFATLSLIADPRTLGLLREAMSKELKGLVTYEVAKDLAGLTPAALVDALRRETALR